METRIPCQFLKNNKNDGEATTGIPYDRKTNNKSIQHLLICQDLGVFFFFNSVEIINGKM
jgi:hypothetical protein